MKKTVVKAGRLVRLESGSYSEYSVRGFFVALRDFNPFDELEEFFKEKPEQRKDYHFEVDEFMAFVIAKGYLLEIDEDILDLGDYGSANFTLSGPE